ncbi:MAG: hypothetical protein DA407_01835 [Bacteroidetes bacterium]|nr:MAG: hypothetical protein DA407_01835 [Bacteroidota bacterium]
MKNIIYLLAFTIMVLSCSDDDKKADEPCFLYSVFVSDSCDCDDLDFDCGELFFISEDEYIRIYTLLENSSETCIFIESEQTVPPEEFEGYLIDINKGDCPFQ